MNRPGTDRSNARPPGLPAGLRDLLAAGGRTIGAAPVDRWNPAFCGRIDMRIAADGRWFYMGSEIRREALVRLFASVLRKDEDGQTYLVTPVEKVAITVEDAPFLAVEMQVDGEGDEQVIGFRTNVGEVVTLDANHALRVETDPENEGLKPYLGVRGRLEALLSRSVTGELVALAESEDDGAETVLFVMSSGKRFEIGRVGHE